MQINRSNYEVWFTDWLDGNLSNNETDLLKQFLNENPDLKEEFNELGKDPIHRVVGNPVSTSDISFPNKEQLKRFPAEISTSQFEYLCIAYLENDLSTDQQAELMEITDQDDEKRRIFHSYQKIKLIPSDTRYKHRSLLLKRTFVQQALRISAIGLSTAAAIILIVTIWSVVSRSPVSNIINTVQNIEEDKSYPGTTQITTTDKITTAGNKVNATDKIKKIRVTPIVKENPVLSESDLTAETHRDTIVRETYMAGTKVNKLFVDTQINFSNKLTDNELVASNATYTMPPEDDGRNKIGRFLAKTFREKILREKAAPDTPLKGYEIAEAGVSGLNKLLGWEMALDKNNDENGKLKSVYFSSKILKFNTPVKKSNSLP